jgi:CTP synthase (UTP-ammonia lyase)
VLRIGIVGDRDAGRPNHRNTEAALQHSARAVGVALEARWFATDALLADAARAELASCAGVWCTTGCPFRAFEGALGGIRRAREAGLPFLGTCSGFQHAVLEYARNVLGIAGAAHAEYAGSPADSVIAPLACSLAGQWFEVEIEKGCRAGACYGATRAREQFQCSYGIHPRWERELIARGLPIVGRADDGTPRILELPGHPFFVATLFVPQARSSEAAPHPLVTGFVRAAAQPRS